MSDAQDKNNRIIQDAINKLAKQNALLNERQEKLENELIILKAEFANNKQMTAHIVGRGMGSTVHS